MPERYEGIQQQPPHESAGCTKVREPSSSRKRAVYPPLASAGHELGRATRLGSAVELRESEGDSMLRNRKLTDPERAVRRAITTDEMVDLRAGRPEEPELDDPSTGADWAPSRTVSAQLLMELLTNDTGPGPVPALRLLGARISGTLDFEGATLIRPLVLNQCYFEEPIILREARALSLRFRGCFLPGLYAAQLETRGDVDLSGLTCYGDVDLSVAHLGGSLLCDGARLINKGGSALNANGMRVAHTLRCGYGFLAEGVMDLTSARIDGQAIFNGANIAGTDGVALQADGITVGDLMACTAGFLAQGEVRGVGARIGGPLDFSGAEVEGGVVIPLAHIAGQALFGGARLTKPSGVALHGDGLAVDDMLSCGDGFVAEGEVRAVGARVSGPLNFNQANLTNPGGVALRLHRLTALELHMEFRRRPVGSVDLSLGHVGSIHDSSSTWPERGDLKIRGLTYDVVSAHPEIKIRDRLRWLRLDEGFLPQPYEQLAAAYRRTGHEEAARLIEVAKRWYQRPTLNQFSRLWNWLLYITVGYGYRTWIAALWLSMFTAVGTKIFAEAYPRDMHPLKSPSPPFDPLVYTLDVLLPIVNLGQQDAWMPEGSALRWSWWLIGAGWLLTTAVVAGLTSVLKRDQS
jgi:hypothetical protein